MTILHYHHLRHYATVFLCMTGLRVAEFDTLAKDLLPQFEVAERGRLARANRQRAVGAGEKPHLDSRDQLLLTVIWLRQYPTHDVLGFFFGVSQPTVGRYIERMLPILEQAGRDTMRPAESGPVTIGFKQDIGELFASLKVSTWNVDFGGEEIIAELTNTAKISSASLTLNLDSDLFYVIRVERSYSSFAYDVDEATIEIKVD